MANSRTAGFGLAAVLGLAMLAGCAAPPGTPGAGLGKDYTPVIDTQNTDMTRYNADLADCRRYASSIDEGAAAFNGALAGAVASAALYGMLGGRGSNNFDQVATAGGFSGLSAAGAAATASQKRIMVNCMAGRGYRALDAAVPVMPVAQAGPRPMAGQPMAGGAPVPNVYPADRPLSYGGPGQQVASIDPSAPTDVGRSMGVIDPLPPQTQDTGRDSYLAQKLAQSQRCAAQANPKLVSKVPGVEVFSVPCDNGDVLAVRCEFGNCRALR